MPVIIDLSRPSSDFIIPLQTAFKVLAADSDFQSGAKLAKALLKDCGSEEWDTFAESVAGDLFSTFTTQMALSSSKIVKADPMSLACAVWNGLLVFVVYALQDGYGPLYYSISPKEPARRLADYLGDRLYEALSEVQSLKN
jgi:hypothetical protein